jgi:hypothetical protein
MRNHGFAFALVIALSLAVGFVLTRSSITQDRCDMIEVGMDKSDVVALLGRPNGFAKHGRWFTPTVRSGESKHQVLYWHTSNAAIEVWLDKEGCVAFKRYWTGGESLKDKISRWILAAQN